MPSPTLAKTEAGQREVRERGRTLSRPARTLLVLADGSRTGESLLAMVQGATPADLQALIDGGLLAPRGSSTGAPTSAAAPERAVADAGIDLELPTEPVASSALGYQELYDALTALVKEQLGLLRGYKFALEVEKASGRDELVQVAERFAAEVAQRKGEAVAKVVRRALGLAG